MEKVFILTQYSLPEYKHNMNAYQRIYFGANYAQIHLLIRRNQSVSREIAERVTLHRSPVENRLLFFLYAVFLAIFLRLQGCRIIITEPSGFAGVGFLAKYLAGYFWVMDVWDPIRWRPDRRERGLPPLITDRLVFFLMGLADLYLLSVLPPAVRDISLDPTKCVQLYNSISLNLVAATPPIRPKNDATLHVALARSQLTFREGVDLVLRAAILLKKRELPVLIHLIGQLSPDLERSIQESPAASLFKIHGFIKESRIDFFRQIHVGLVPYLPLENLSYLFPIKVLEHLSQGNPVIASRLPGLCATITHEVNGLLFEPDNAESLADAIQRLQQDYPLWERLAWNALDSIKKFDVKQKNRIIYQEILQRVKA